MFEPRSLPALPMTADEMRRQCAMIFNVARAMDDARIDESNEDTFEVMVNVETLEALVRTK